MDHWREAWAVIGRNIAYLTLLLGFRVYRGISAADKPEHRWRAPLSSERPKVLARRRRLGCLHAVSSEVLTKSLAYSFG